MKILLLSHRFSPDIGGIEVNSEIYARAFAVAGHQVRLLTWSTTDAEDYFPFTVIRNPSKWTLFREHAWADIVFENNPCARLAWPGVFFGRPFIISLNTEFRRADGLYWLKRAWLKRARTVIAVSEALRRKCWPVAAVIGNPYRAEEFKRLPGIARTGDFVFLGRLVSQKGASHAILALHQVMALLGEQPGAAPPSLTIIGDGPERAALEELAATLGIAGSVHFTGFLHGAALAEQLNRYQFLLVPSLYGEAFGNVVLEGIACGCLPIVSDSGGLPDAVGPAGLVFRRGSVEALVASIWQLLHDPALDQLLRQAGPAHLTAHRPALVAHRYLQVLDAAFRPDPRHTAD